jgi:ankyrin repeat protein
MDDLRTPLHWVAQGGYSDVIRLLLDRGMGGARQLN